MVKKKTYFNSQLFLFADKFSPNFDIYFSNKLIESHTFLQNKTSSLQINSDYPQELKIFNHFVSKFDKQYKEVRIVLNHNESQLLLYQLSNSNLHTYLLRNKESYKTLVNFGVALDYIDQLESMSYKLFLYSIPIYSVTQSLAKSSRSTLKKSSTTAIKVYVDYLQNAKDALYQSFINNFCAVI